MLSKAELVALRIVGGGGGASYSERILSKFAGGDEVILITPTVSGVNIYYEMYQHVGSRKYWYSRWQTAQTVGANSIFLGYEWIVDYYRALNSTTTPACTRVGTWSTSGTGLSLYQRCTSGAGGYAELVTDGGVTAVGASIPSGLTNGMMHLVTIDGDNTLADLLPTAQTLVDAGTLPSTCLVANGGTLNPTDRMLDTYNKTAASVPNSFTHTIFTKTLAATAHTVRITMTAYKNAASTGNWWVFGYFLEHGATIPGAATAGSVPFFSENIRITPDVRVDEISYNFKPSGASVYDWLGHTNSLKWSTLPTVSVDGTPITPATGATWIGSTITATTVLNVRHSQTSTTNIGAMALTYSLNKSTGLTTSYTLTWLTNGVVNSYPVMLAVEHATMDRFATEDYPLGADLTANDDSFNFPSDGQVALTWDYSGYVAKMMYMPSLLKNVNNWADATTNKLAWADVAANIWKKAYVTRYTADHSYIINEALECETNYRVNWFSEGANAALT